MPELRIDSKSTVANAEDALERLCELPPHTNLVLPTKLRARYFGGMSAQLQVAISWHRRCPSGRLRMYAHQQDDAAALTAKVRNFVLASDHGYIACEMADHIEGRSGAPLNSVARPFVVARRDGMNSVRDAARGSKVLLA